MTKEDGSDSIVIAITCLQTSDLCGANLKKRAVVTKMVLWKLQYDTSTNRLPA